MYMIPVYIPAALYGACIGSFLNVVIYRLPNGMNLAKPASHCTKCSYVLKWYDNIPIISYIILRGRCRKCGEKISFRYPFVEILNTLLWILSVYLFWDKSILFAVAAAIASSLLICIAIIDLETKYMYDVLTYLLSVPVLMMILSNVIWGTGASRADRLITGAAAGLLFLTIYLLARLILKREGLGSGDVILSAFLGAMLGWKAAVFSLLIAGVTGCAVLIPLSMRAKKKSEQNGESEETREYPFGPFLVLGALVALFFADPVINWYLSLLGL